MQCVGSVVCSPRWGWSKENAGQDRAVKPIMCMGRRAGLQEGLVRLATKRLLKFLIDQHKMTHTGE